MEITYFSHTPGNRSLLLYFSGWGTTPEVVAHLKLPEGRDYCAFHDFRSIDSPLPDFSSYDEIYLVAWSMGVWAAEALSSRLPHITSAIAVNGTPLPMHDRYGIPKAIFFGTLNGLDEVSREKFDRRLAGGKKLLAVYKSFHARPTDELRSELQEVYDHVSGHADDISPETSLKWTVALISEKDLVIPPDNQVSFWEKAGVRTKVLPGAGHYPFYAYSSWSELFQLASEDDR